MTLVKPRKISTEAKKFGLTVNVKKKDGKDAVVFPSAKKELKELLRFLEHRYYQSPLTGDKYLANSKRRILGP
jgi:hypothetical protein